MVSRQSGVTATLADNGVYRPLARSLVHEDVMDVVMEIDVTGSRLIHAYMRQRLPLYPHQTVDFVVWRSHVILCVLSA